MSPRDGTRRETRLAFYLTAEHPCSYLEGRSAQTLFVDPQARIDTMTYQTLLDQGFRRSGGLIYRPACPECARCVPVRVPVADFRPNRAQRRTWTRNVGDLQVKATPPRFVPEQFQLYQRYLAHRHPAANSAEDHSATSYRRFLVAPWGGETRFLELHLEGRLAGVAVTDFLPRGLSAVYTFFDPDLSSRGPGTFAILAQIETARRLCLPYLYLGYWIAESPKMAYKSRYRPLETWDGTRWGPGHATGGTEATDR